MATVQEKWEQLVAAFKGDKQKAQQIVSDAKETEDLMQNMGLASKETVAPVEAEVKSMDEEMKKKMDAEHEASESPDKEKAEEAKTKETVAEQPKEEVVAKEVTALDAKLMVAINDWQEKHTAYVSAKEAMDKEVVDLKQMVAAGFTSLKELSEQHLATIKELQASNKELQDANVKLNQRLQSLEGDQPRYLSGFKPTDRTDNIIDAAKAKEMAATLNDPKSVPIFGFNQGALEAMGLGAKQ